MGGGCSADQGGVIGGLLVGYWWVIGGLLVGVFSEQWVLKDIPWIALHEHHAFQ